MHTNWSCFSGSRFSTGTTWRHPALWAALSAAAVTPAPQAQAQLDPSRPNILMIMVDDLGFNDLGCYTFPSKSNPGPPPAAVVPGNGDSCDPNHAIHTTPRLDALAAQGARLTHFYSSMAICTPTRAALLTGSYPRRIGIRTVFNPKSNEGLHSEEVTLAELLRERGYLTALAGKWHIGSQREFNPRRHGFERFFGILYSHDMWKNANSNWGDMFLMNGESQQLSYQTATGGVIDRQIDTNTEQSYLLEAMTEQALQTISDAASQGRPFFLLYTPHVPHVPIIPHPSFLSAAGATNQDARYRDVLREMDARVGDLLDRIQQLGLTNNTIVMFTSDNGPYQSRPNSSALHSGAGSAYPLRGSKNTGFEGGHRVPFLARFPGRIPAGAVLDQTAATQDLFATLLGWAGIALPTDRVLDSVDLRPILTGQSTAEPRSGFFFYANNAQTAGGILDIVSGQKWKLGLDGRFHALGVGFSGDFQENVDLSSSQATRKAEVNARLNDWNNTFAARPLGVAQSVRIELEVDSVEVERGGQATFRVRLSAPSNRTVTVSRYRGGNRLSVVSGSSIAFTNSNWNQWRTVTVAAAPSGTSPLQSAIFRVESGTLHLREVYAYEREHGQANQAPRITRTTPHGPWVVFPNSAHSLKLELNVSDDGLPAGMPVKLDWSVVSGPSNVTFSAPGSPTTNVSFSGPGTYHLRAIASDSLLSSREDIFVVVGAVGQPSASPRRFFYPFSEGSGPNTADASGVTGTAFLTENGVSTAAGPLWTQGVQQTGLYFDGEDDFVVTPSVPVAGGTSYTAMAWVRLDSLSPTNTRVLLQQTGANGRTWLFVRPDGRLATSIGNSELNGGSVEPGLWTHVAVRTVAGGATTLLINGQPVASASRTLESQNGGFYIGEHKNLTQAGTVNWHGAVDSVMLFASALDDQDIFAHAASTLPVVSQ